MERKILLFSLIGILVVTVSGVLYFSYDEPLDTPTIVIGEESQCNIISEGGEGSINMVLISGNAVAEDYVDYFVEAEPFSKHKDKFNFYNIEIDNVDDYCELYAGDVFFCYSKEVVRLASVCPNDYIIVLGEHPTSIRSSAYMNFMSINLNHPMSVLLHEFGHAFADLAEEYVDEGAKIPWKARNCVDECEDFDSIGGCYEGCTKSNYYRSSQKSVMRTLDTNNYYDFNNKVIEEKILDDYSGNFLTGNVVKEGSVGDCYLVVISEDGKTASKTKIKDCKENGVAQDSGRQILVNRGGEVVYSTFIDEELFTSKVGPNKELSGDTKILEGVEIAFIVEANLIEKKSEKIYTTLVKDGEIVEVKTLDYDPSKTEKDVEKNEILDEGKVKEVGEVIEKDVSLGVEDSEIVGDSITEEVDAATSLEDASQDQIISTQEPVAISEIFFRMFVPWTQFFGDFFIQPTITGNVVEDQGRVEESEGKIEIYFE